jgi:hypothetical protein
VIVLLRHTSGTAKIQDPLKLIAADINCDGLVDSKDFDLLYGLVTGSIPYTDLPKHWRFIPKSFIFINPANPFADAFESPMDFNNITSSKTNVNFMAIRVGELDGVKGFDNDSELSFRNDNSNHNLNFELQNVFPNPVTDQYVHFQFNIHKSSNLIIQWYDAQGNFLQRNSRSFDKGVQIWQLPVKQVSTHGFIFYRISDGTETAFGKLILSE